MDRQLQVRNLRISFNTDNGILKAVRGVSVDIKKGETLCIVGESGSGKTVTAKAILGILAGNSIIEGGEIIYNGKDILKCTEKELNEIRRNNISMVFQDPMTSLDPVMKVGKQITEVIMMRVKSSKKKTGVKSKSDKEIVGGKSKSEIKRIAYEKAVQVMKDVGIKGPEECFDKYPFELSGGMRQRIVIALALVTDPDILICDEPTTALDVTIQEQILELIEDIKRKRGISVIFITHDLGVVANIADKVAVMYAGKIVEYGTADDIFYHPAHPYTWALLASVPDLDTKKKLEAIPGNPPNMIDPPAGDAFAERNPYARPIDFEKEPPMFKISDTHYAATWLLDSDAPKIEIPRSVTERINRYKMQLYSK